jgi:hypothetical protein
MTQSHQLLGIGRCEQLQLMHAPLRSALLRAELSSVSRSIHSDAMAMALLRGAAPSPDAALLVDFPTV